MNCPRCGKENDPANQFCGRCGLEFAQVAPTDADPGEVLFCHKHKREKTVLRCGRCERPICTRCVVIGPAGPRCRECSRHQIAMRPQAMLFEMKRILLAPFRAGGISTWILGFLILSIAFGTIRGCNEFLRRPPAPERFETPAADSPP